MTFSLWTPAAPSCGRCLNSLFSQAPAIALPSRRLDGRSTDVPPAHSAAALGCVTISIASEPGPMGSIASRLLPAPCPGWVAQGERRSGRRSSSSRTTGRCAPVFDVAADRLSESSAELPLAGCRYSSLPLGWTWRFYRSARLFFEMSSAAALH
jgi:hypothetical protein